MGRGRESEAAQAVWCCAASVVTPCAGDGMHGACPRADSGRACKTSRSACEQRATCDRPGAPLWDMDPADADAYFGTVLRDAASGPH
jgi:hypothetical protein